MSFDNINGKDYECVRCNNRSFGAGLLNSDNLEREFYMRGKNSKVIRTDG